MFWQCSECGGLIDAVPRMSVCPECGTACSQFLPDPTSGWDLSELRDHWLYTGMEQQGPLLDFTHARPRA